MKNVYMAARFVRWENLGALHPDRGAERVVLIGQILWSSAAVKSESEGSLGFCEVFATKEDALAAYPAATILELGIPHRRVQT